MFLYTKESKENFEKEGHIEKRNRVGFWVRNKHVCFKCRIGNKHGGECTKCRGLMVRVMNCFPIPKKGNKKAWKALENDLMLKVSKNSKKPRPINTKSCWRWINFKPVLSKGEKSRDCFKIGYFDN
jgi:hypothetical protein